jgi:hypothetical protein
MPPAYELSRKQREQAHNPAMCCKLTTRTHGKTRRNSATLIGFVGSARVPRPIICRPLLNSRHRLQRVVNPESDAEADALISQAGNLSPSQALRYSVSRQRRSLFDHRSPRTLFVTEEEPNSLLNKGRSTDVDGRNNR